MDNGNLCCDKLKEDFSSFTTEVEKIFVDSTVAVIDRVRELVDSSLDDVKSVIDKTAHRARLAGEQANEYVRQNPWKAAAAFIAFSIIVTAVSRKRS